MHSITEERKLNVDGRIVNVKVVRESEGLVGESFSVPAALAGSLSTRSGNTTGIVTLAEGHGLTTSDLVLLEWATGRRWAIPLSGHGATTVTLDGGSGDNLPDQATAVTISRMAVITTSVVGDDVEKFSISADQDFGVRLLDDSAAEIDTAVLDAEEAWAWSADTGLDNPLAGDVLVTIQVASRGAAAAVEVLVLHDNVA